MKMRAAPLRTKVSALALTVTLVVVALVTGITGHESPAHADVAATGGLFTPSQQRVYDSRSSTYAGNSGTALASGTWYPVTIGGVGGVPKTGISAVQVTLTEVSATAAGNLKADKSGTSTPNTSVAYLLWNDGKESTAATIPIGTDGKFQIYVTTQTDIVIDLQGYYTSGTTAGGGYSPGSNVKLLGSSSTVYDAGQTKNIQVAGTDAVPAGASAVMLSILIIPKDTTAGNLTVYPTGTPPQTPWLLNWSSSENTVVTSAVALTSNGQVTLAFKSGSVGVQVAVQGYFTQSDGSSKAGSFTAQRARVLDTRSSTSLAPDETRVVQVAGTAGLSAEDGVVAAVAANVVVYPGSGTTGKGSVLLSADDAPENFWSQFFYPDEKVSGFGVTTVGSDGGITIHNNSSGTIDVVIDTEGWFQGLDAATVTCPTGISNGSWQAAVFSSDVTCQIVAPKAPSGRGYLDISQDGADLASVPLSATGTTSSTVTFTAGGGAHELVTTVHGDKTGVQNSDLFDFGSGLWAAGGFIPNVADGAQSGGLTPALWADGTQAPYTDDAVIKYTLSAASDLSQPIAVTSWGIDPLKVTSGQLTAGTRYYWNAEVKGSNNAGGGTADVVTPTWSFVASTYTEANIPDLSDTGTTTYSNDPATSGSTTTSGTTTSDTTDSSTPATVGKKRCSQYVIIVVRGTFDKEGSGTSASGFAYKSGGFGSHLNLVNKLQKDTSITVFAESIIYKASAFGIKGATYKNSLNGGISALYKEMNNAAGQCKKAGTKLWIVGHSQGAEVVGKAFTEGTIFDYTYGQIKGVALTGDPTYHPKEKIDYQYNGTGRGYRGDKRADYNLDSYKGTTKSGNSDQMIRSYCYANDAWCQNGLDLVVHNHYGDDATVSQEYVWLKHFK